MKNFHLIIDSEDNDVISRWITAKRRQNDGLVDGDKSKNGEISAWAFRNYTKNIHRHRQVPHIISRISTVRRQTKYRNIWRWDARQIDEKI